MKGRETIRTKNSDFKQVQSRCEGKGNKKNEGLRFRHFKSRCSAVGKVMATNWYLSYHQVGSFDDHVGPDSCL